MNPQPTTAMRSPALTGVWSRPVTTQLTGSTIQRCRGMALSGGIRWARCAATLCTVAKPRATTASPSATPVTPRPTLMTRPTPSWPAGAALAASLPRR